MVRVSIPLVLLLLLPLAARCHAFAAASSRRRTFFGLRSTVLDYGVNGTVAQIPQLQQDDFATNSMMNETKDDTIFPEVTPGKLDAITKLVVGLPTSWQHKMRDTGAFRWLADAVVAAGIPIAAASNWSATKRMFELSRIRKTIRYGDHPRQCIDLFSNVDDPADAQNLIVFAHGGAWGSGLPWFYWLVADPFLRHIPNCRVAVVGYRTYPDADVQGQARDMENAIAKLQTKPSNCIAVGHSSGSHILLTMLAERARRSGDDLCARVDTFIGICGPWDIASHYEFESRRGVEEISPMKPACGGIENFHRNSPVRILQSLGLQKPLDQNMFLLHGTADSTVPVQATVRASEELQEMDIVHRAEYLEGTEHQQTILELMLGGKTQDTIFEWITEMIPGMKT